LDALAEAMYGVLAVAAGIFFILVVPGLALRANSKANELRRDLSLLKAEIAGLRAAPPPPATPQTEVVQPAETVAVETVTVVAVEAVVVASETPQPEPAAAFETVENEPDTTPASRNLEQKIGSKLFVWIGSIMLALAGIFLVKYSIDENLMSPAMRVGLGLVMGVVLLAVGQKVRAPKGNISQALAAASVADLFASLFAAISLYHLIPPAFGFLLLAVLTGTAIALALREGPFVGLVGLAGGFLTPALVQTDNPKPWALFIFLFFVQLGALVLQHKRGWWYLAGIGIGGGLLWVVIWCLFVGLPDADGHRIGQVWVPLFLLATQLTQLWSLYGQGGVPVSKEMNWTARASSAACFLLMVLWLMQGGYRLDDWAFAILLAVSHLVAARRFLAEEIPAMAGTGLVVLAYIGWNPHYVICELAEGGTCPDWHVEMIWVGLVFGAILTFGAYWFELRARHPARWAALSTLGGAFLFGGAYINLWEGDLLFSWPVIAILLAVLHMIAAERLNKRRLLDPHYVGAFALHCLAVSGFIAIAIPMRLEKDWVAVAWALELPVIAFVAGRLDIPWLRKSVWVGGALVLAALWFSGFPAGERLIFNWLLYGIGIPCAGFIATAQILKRKADDQLVLALELGGSALGALLVGMEIDHFFHHIGISDGGADFLKVGCIAIAFAVLGAALLYRQRLRPRRATLWAGLAFTALALLALVLGAFIVFNPLFSDIHVGSTPIFNRLLLVYGVPTVLLFWSARELQHVGMLQRFKRWPSAIVGVIALISGFLWFSYEVRQLFHGTVLYHGGIEDAEQFGYSVAWAVYGLTLLGLGTVFRSQVLRYASAVVVLLTVCKVFLIDASDLTGLYRVASFLGLGVSLIGIGFLYQRLLFRKT
jgi:uncharacterized membrane protein